MADPASGETWLDGLFLDLHALDTDCGSGCASGHSSGTEDAADDWAPPHALPLDALAAPLLPGDLGLGLASPAAAGAPRVFPAEAADDILGLLESGACGPHNVLDGEMMPHADSSSRKPKRRVPAATPHARKRRSPESFSSADSLASDSSACAPASSAGSAWSSTGSIASGPSAFHSGAPPAAAAASSCARAQRRRAAAAADRPANAASSRRPSGTSGSASSGGGSVLVDAAEARRLKREQKKARNRQLAAESRERRKNRMETMERENQDLRIRVRDLEAEVRALRRISQPCAQGLRRCDAEGSDDEHACHCSRLGQQPAAQADEGDMCAHAEGSDDKRRRAVAAAHSTKLGTAAMALTMSMVVVTDSSGGARGGISAGSGGSFELIGIWALALDLLNGTGLALDLLLPHVLALLFGTTLTFAFVAAYYCRVLHSKRPLFELPTQSRLAQTLQLRKSASALPTTRLRAVLERWSLCG